jgi:hypothetical protein
MVELRHLRSGGSGTTEGRPGQTAAPDGQQQCTATVLLLDEGRCRASTDRVPAHTSCSSIAGTSGSRGLAAASGTPHRRAIRAVSQLQATTGPLRHPSAVEVCRVFSRRLDRSRSVRLPVPCISICASGGDNEACSSCTSSFAPEPAYARGYRLSTRGGGAHAWRAGRAVPCDQRAPPFACEQSRCAAGGGRRSCLNATADAESLAAPGGAVEIRPEQQRTVNPAELSSSRDLAEGLARADHREHHGVPQHGSDADDEPPALDESEQWLGAA